MSWTQIFNAIDEQRAGGLAWLRYRLDMAGFEGSNPFRPTIFFNSKLSIFRELLTYESFFRDKSVLHPTRLRQK